MNRFMSTRACRVVLGTSLGLALAWHAGAQPSGTSAAPTPAAAAASAAGTPPAVTAAAAEARDRAFRKAVTEALWIGDFARLATLHAEATDPRAADAGGARSRLHLFVDGLDDTLDFKPLNLPGLRLLARRIAEQEAQEPGQALWPALHAQVLLTQAWRVRGGGYANTVPPHAWDEFHGLLRQAIEHLSARGEPALATPLAHVVLLNASRGLGLPHARQDALLEDGLKRHPAADSLVFVALASRLPRWHGDATEVDRFIRRHASRLAHANADEGYALLYSRAAAAEFSHRLFENSRADWPRMRQGYRSMLARRDNDGRRQRAAYFACLARDRDAWLEFSARGMEPPQLDEWGDNARVTYDGCRRWGASQ